MERKSFAIGIDLGTTNSRVCFWNNDRFEIIRNDQGNRATPSFVAFTEDERLVGEDAFHQVTMNATNTIFDSKRLIGRRFSDKAVQDDIKLWPFKVVAGNDDKPMIRVTLNNGETKEVSPEEISSMVLSQLKKMAEDHLGSEVKDAVISVPANYDQSQRQATINAGEIAGLNVLRLINEPTAAAIYYSYDSTFGIREKRNVLICDLGGGKFDVSCLTITKDRIEVRAAGGDSHLGGQDFDTRLVSHFVEVFKRKHKKDISGNPRAMRRLRTACEKAKRSLSVLSQARISVDDLYEGVEYFSERITRSEFEELNSDLFNKCIEGVEKCLIDAKMDKKDVDEIVLVGGSSRIPKIQQMLREFMNGKEIYKSINADEAIVNGAAIQAAILSGQRSPRFQNLALKDVTSLSLGIEIRGKFMYVFIPKNTAIPTRVVKEVTTAHDYQTSIKIPVYEGERARTKDNKFLGEMILTGIKPALRRVPEIDVCFSLQGDGILDVSARDKNTGKEISITIKDVRSSAEEVQRMIKEANEYRANDEMYKRKGVARYALEIYIVQVRNEMKSIAMHLQNDDKRKVDNAIRMAVKLLDSRELAEVDEYENEKKRLMSVMDVVRRMEN